MAQVEVQISKELFSRYRVNPSDRLFMDLNKRCECDIGTYLSKLELERCISNSVDLNELQDVLKENDIYYIVYDNNTQQITDADGKVMNSVLYPIDGHAQIFDSRQVLDYMNEEILIGNTSDLCIMINLAV